MAWMIAVDSGGTKTDCVLFNEAGHILHRSLSLGGNPLDVGADASRRAALEVLRDMTARAPERPAAVYAAIAGVYYFDEYELFPPAWRAQIDTASLRIDDDGRSLISSELFHDEDGCGLVCGTGASIWIRQKGVEPIVHVGGWGYLIDALGSGYALGRNAVQAAARAADGRGEDTVLVSLVEADLGKPLVRCMPDLYAGGRRRIAALAYTVFRGAEMGDKVCLDILDDGSDHIAALIRTAARRFDGPFPVILGGGIAVSFPEYVRMILAKSPPEAELRVSQAPPVFGGAAEAMKDAGLPVTPAFRAAFLREYAAWSARQAR